MSVSNMDWLVHVYVIAWEGVKFGINFMSCSENANEIARGAANLAQPDPLRNASLRRGSGDTA